MESGKWATTIGLRFIQQLTAESPLPALVNHSQTVSLCLGCVTSSNVFSFSYFVSNQNAGMSETQQGYLFESFTESLYLVNCLLKGFR